MKQGDPDRTAPVSTGLSVRKLRIITGTLLLFTNAPYVFGEIMLVAIVLDKQNNA